MSGGAVLAGRYYRDVVAPLLARRWPGLPHAAARLGSGSDVLGVDDASSRDHDWGLRLTLLVSAGLVQEVAEHLERDLPHTYAGLPTRFSTTWDAEVRQRVEVATAEDFVTSRLGLDASRDLDARDWLCLTGQSLLEVTAGPVFADTMGTLTRIREALIWYPDDVWRYVVAVDWARLGEDLPLMGRTGQLGDDLGSRVLAGRVAHTAMHLAYMIARRWPPYPKWMGTILAQLSFAADLVPALTVTMTADDWRQRQFAGCRALDILYRAQADAGLPTLPGSPIRPFFDRPYVTVRSEVVTLLVDEVVDPLVRRLPPGVGAIEQWADNVKVLADPARRVRVACRQLRTEPAVP